MKKERVKNSKSLSPKCNGSTNSMTAAREGATSRDSKQPGKKTPVRNRKHRRVDTGSATLPPIKSDKNINAICFSQQRSLLGTNTGFQPPSIDNNAEKIASDHTKNTDKLTCISRRCHPPKLQSSIPERGRRSGAQVSSANLPPGNLELDQVNGGQGNTALTTLPSPLSGLGGQRSEDQVNPVKSAKIKELTGRRSEAQVTTVKTLEITAKPPKSSEYQDNAGLSTLPLLTTVIDPEFTTNLKTGNKIRRAEEKRRVDRVSPVFGDTNITANSNTDIALNGDDKNTSASIRTRARKNLIINNSSDLEPLFSFAYAQEKNGGVAPSFFGPERGLCEDESRPKEELPYVTLTDEELEYREREKKKSSSLRAKIRKLRKPRPPVEETKSLSALFDSDQETRARMIAILEGEHGVQVRTILKRHLRAEVFRVYRVERERVTKGGKFFVTASERNIEAANNLAKACIYYELTPRQFIRYWQEPKNNFTSMSFPPLTFIGAAANVDTVVCTLTPIIAQAAAKVATPRKGAVFGHAYDVEDLHPDLRPTLIAAGHDLSKWDNRALMSVQNFAIDTYYDWPIEDFDPEVQPLIRTAIPLYAERSGGK